jgi:Glycosyltransferase family 92
MIRGNRQVLKLMFTKREKKKRLLALCIRPLFGIHIEFAKIANSILYYSQVGVNHFVFYNTGVASPRLIQLIEIVKNAGVSIELRPWLMQDKSAYEHLQTMNIEICLHSLIGHFKYVGVVST